MNACKVSELLRNEYPDIIVYNIHKDLVFPDPQSHDFYQKQKDNGTEFVYCPDLSTVRVSEVEEKGNLKVDCAGFVLHDVDMVVLAEGLRPAKGTKTLAEMLDCDLSSCNYLVPDHGLLHNTGSMISGIYMAGCAVKPSNVPDSITQARGVAGDILSKLIPGKEIDLEIMTAVIDPEKCAGCKFCIGACPFKAITFDCEKQVSVVNEALCRGCGTCAATCASSAVKAKHFTDEQIFAEIGGILDA